MDAKGFGRDQVHRLLAGEVEAGRAFAARFVPLLRIKIRRRRPGVPEAQVTDWIQETFVRVLAALRAGRVQDLDRLGGFVSGVCENLLLEGAARAGRQVALDELPEPLRSLDDPEGAAVLSERARQAAQLFDTLSPRDREVLQLIFVEEVARDEVCRRYQITREHLRVLVHRARERLRELVDQDPLSAPRPPTPVHVTQR